MYRKNFFSKPRARYLHYIAKVMQKNAKVLEVGCGWGHDGNELKKLRPDVKYVGIDVSETCVIYASQHFSLECKCTSAERLNDFKKNQFDLIFSFDTLEHLQNIIQHFANAHRILKLKGDYIFDYPNRFYYPYTLTKVGAIKQTLFKLRTSRWRFRRQFRELVSLLENFFNKTNVMREHPLTFISHSNFLFPQEVFAILDFFNFKRKYIKVDPKHCFGHFVKDEAELINIEKFKNI